MLNDHHVHSCACICTFLHNANLHIRNRIAYTSFPEVHRPERVEQIEPTFSCVSVAETTVNMYCIDSLCLGMNESKKYNRVFNAESHVFLRVLLYVYCRKLF